MIPRPFQSLGTLRNLNIAAVALSLATITSGVLGLIVADQGRFGLSTFVNGLPTLIVGAVWAALLRWRKTIGSTSFRWAWLLSVPLAMINAGVAAGILLVGQERGSELLSVLVMGFVLGCTLGAAIWVPALVATLIAFGIPIAWSQSLARKGLAGEERGEWIVGICCAVLSAFGLVLALAVPAPLEGNWRSWEPSWHRTLEYVGRGLLYGLGSLGVLLGGASTLLARSREAQRRRFVAEAEAGRMSGFRVDESPEGKVLVRVSSQGGGYRVADFREEVFLLDEEGQAQKALVIDGPRKR